MSDIIKTFYNYGKYFEDDLLQSFNQLSSKKIDKILYIELTDYDYQLVDPETLEDRIILYITSSAGGNLFPFIFLSEKVFDIEANGKIKKGGIVKSFENMKKYLDAKEQEELDTIFKALDIEKLKTVVAEIEADKTNFKDNYYLALSHENLFFNEKFPSLFQKMVQTKGSDISLDGHCFIDKSATKIGFDAGINFCSTNEMNDTMGSRIKPRLLPISKEAGRFVKLGFEKIFNDFQFKLFGLNYILLPTVFDTSLNRDVFNEINNVKKIDKGDQALTQRILLEEDLEEVVEEFEKKDLTNTILFTMLFYQKNNKEIIVSHTIEDIAPSRINSAIALMKRYDIDASKLSKYEKKTIKDANPELIYIRDYINDRLYLAKLLFGKERIESEVLYQMLYKKIIFGNNIEHDKREFSKILNGYYKDDINFTKHQNLLAFLADETLQMADFIQLGGDMKFENLENLVTWKFENVTILQTPSQREFFVMGILCRLVIAWQKAKNENNSSLESYLNTIGTVNTLNIESVYRKVIDGAGKYKVYGKDYDYLLTLYSEIKSLQKNEKVSNDKANILFVMGFTDYKNLLKTTTKGEES
ncbi:MAG: TM1802 family CRISPR-associated protein [Campylobacterota bacterium]|nr:TM1802 family CRISPR-associated protein [Campylobacterota bacterium]